MDQQSIAALTRRVDALERENRRLKRMGLVVLAAGAALFLMAQTRPPGTVQTTRLDLVDATGTVRATLGVTYPDNADQSGPNLSLGAPSLTFYKRDGSLGALIGTTIDPESGSISLAGVDHTVVWQAP